MILGFLLFGNFLDNFFFLVEAFLVVVFTNFALGSSLALDSLVSFGFCVLEALTSFNELDTWLLINSVTLFKFTFFIID